MMRNMPHPLRYPVPSDSFYIACLRFERKQLRRPTRAFVADRRRALVWR